MKFFLATMALLSSCSVTFADDDFSKVIVKSTVLTPHIYMIEGAGGNITASIGVNGTLLVDDDFAEMAGKLILKLKELKGDSPRFIVNTHFHYDHTGGNEVFGPTATVISTTAARQRLMTEQTLWHKQHPPLSSQGWPLITFDQSLTMHVNNDEVRLVHLPHGHTDGDLVVFFQNSKIVSMGDLYFAGMYPIFHPEHDGHLENYRQNLATILAQIADDWKVIPGHGPLSNKAQLTLYYRMIEDSLNAVRKEKMEGLTLAQIQKKGLDPKWESFSHGFRSTDQWLASIYAEIH